MEKWFREKYEKEIEKYEEKIKEDATKQYEEWYAENYKLR